MNILITNIEFSDYNGTTLYVKELALSLKKRGNNVQIYSLVIGEIGEELIRKGVFATNNLKEITFTPDIIHAHHNINTLDVISYFKKTPVIFWIHDRIHKYDYPLLHKNIIQYVSVDYNCKERYKKDLNFNKKDSKVIYNWVNLERFKLKSNINSIPKKALIFSNYAKNNHHLNEIKTACYQSQISLDVIGSKSGNTKYDPENYLNDYDIIFAKAKAAMESITTGAGVIVCDFTGLAGFVTSKNVSFYRKYNFGMKLMKLPVTSKNILSEIKKYNEIDIKIVSKSLRNEIDLDIVIEQLLVLYTDSIHRYKNNLLGEKESKLSNLLYIKALKLNFTLIYKVKNHFPVLFSLLKKILKK